MGSASLPPRESLAASDALGAARQQLQYTELWYCYIVSLLLNIFIQDYPPLHISNASLARSVENAHDPLSPTDPDLLYLKAVSAASTHCLLQCLGLLQRHQEIQDNRSESAF